MVQTADPTPTIGSRRFGVTWNAGEVATGPDYIHSIHAENKGAVAVLNRLRAAGFVAALEFVHYNPSGTAIARRETLLDECEELREALECAGHPAGAYDEQGETVFCGGECRRAWVLA